MKRAIFDKGIIGEPIYYCVTNPAFFSPYESYKSECRHKPDLWSEEVFLDAPDKSAHFFHIPHKLIFLSIKWKIRTEITN